MGWSIRVARVAGIDVKVHVTFLLFLAWLGLDYYLRGGWAAAQEGLLFILLIFACVVLHEFGHAFAARRYGITTADITLLPIGGIARIARIPKDPRQELVIAAAGPAVNVLIAGLLYVLPGRVVDLGNILALEDYRVGLLSKLLTVNVWLVLFNLIPAFPMDGGRILRSLLALRMPYPRASQIAAGIGQAIAFGFGFLGLFFNPVLLFIALFVYLGASQEAAVAQMRSLAERVPVSAAMMTHFRVLPLEARVSDAVAALLGTSQHEFPVVDPAGRLAGVLTRDDLIAALEELGPDAGVTRVMRTPVPTVTTRTPFERAFDLMEQSRSPVVAVTGEEGQLAGLLTPEAVGELLLVHSALHRQRSWGGWLRPRIATARTG